MKEAIRESLNDICVALNRLDELEQAERDAMQKLKLQRISETLVRARRHLIEQERKESR